MVTGHQHSYLRWIAVTSLGILLCNPISAQVTERISVDSAHAQGDGDSRSPAISADGRYVAFYSFAGNLIANDTNEPIWDVFVRDRHSGTTEVVSVSNAGVQGNGISEYPSISADGHYVAFASEATNLAAADTDVSWDVFVRDRQAGTTELISISSGGVAGNGLSYSASISANGRYVAFHSTATNLVANDTNGVFDIFVRDRSAGTTVRASVATSGAQGNGHSALPAISADGRYVAFQTVSNNFAPLDFNDVVDVFVRDLLTSTTERVSLTTNGGPANDASFRPAISADGRYVVFQSYATNLVPGDMNFLQDVFLRDRQAGATELVSVSSAEVQASGPSGMEVSISNDGRCVAFECTAGNLVTGDTNGSEDIFLRDRQSGTTEIISISSSGALGNGHSNDPWVSSDGRYVTFFSTATTLVSGDTNGVQDVFIRDRFASGFTSLCDPGTGGVIPCPCSNPPSGLGRGCNNSAATGGAILTASGIGYLTMDTLVFTTSDEMPAATSAVVQGNALLSAGVVFGQGVRCAGGLLLRLYLKTASAGSITAPNFDAGDPSVSARSAALGDVIQAGENRWYLVYYRDPVVLGGCPASNTFNTTQTGQVSWSL